MGDRAMEMKRSRWRWIWVILLAFLTVAFVGRVAYVFWVPEGEGGGKIAIGPDTTRILAPASPDGWIDYVTAINERHASGVSPETNAAAPLVRALGPSFLPPGARPRVLAALGIDGLPEDGAYFISRPADAARAPATLWPEEEFPKIVEWLRSNEEPLAIAKTAADRPRCFFPLIAPAGAGMAVIEAESPKPQPIVELGEALVTRALGRASEGRIDEAWSDLLAVHKIARHCGEAPAMALRLAGAGLEVLACRCEGALAASGRLSEAESRRLAGDLEALGGLIDPARVVDEDERFSCLSMAIALARESEVQEGEDWDGILREINAWYDALVDVLRQPTFAARARGGRALRGEVSRRRQALRGGYRGLLQTAIRGLLGGRDAVRAMRTREMADLVLSLTSGVVEHLVEFDRAAVDLDLARTACLLAAYKSARGAYPDALEALVPDFAKAIPDDAFTGSPLRYRRTGEGCVIYSFGPNGADDGGEDDGESKDDIAVAMPLVRS
ncbi:MAG: hypothetical protein JXP34_14920 [Planctomycetes bacterium]|nr:hypothetical protein [Planctomycetota bacterium]